MKKIILLLSLIIGTSVFAADMTPSEQANLFYNDGNSKNAMAVLLKIPEADRTGQDWVLIGNILQDEGKDLDAVFMYKRAILVQPEFYKAYYNLGNMYLEDDKYFLAIDNFKKAAKYKEDFPYAYYNLGCAYIETGDLKKAKQAFIKAIDIKNTVPEFHYNLAFVYKKLNKVKLSKQYLDNYNKLLEATPK